MKDIKDIKDIIKEQGTVDELDSLASIWDSVEYIKDDTEYTSTRFRELKMRIERSKRDKIRRLSLTAASVAAVFVVALSVYTVSFDGDKVAKTVAFDYKKTGVDAPINRVTLTVDGKEIGLNSASASLAQNDSIITITTHEGNTVKEVSINKMLTVKVPIGHQFEMTLADGTKVWLNSDSELMYPSAFTGNERRVKIIGEAYFDVAHNEKKPFIVSVNGQYDVKVLGTEFNVNSYPDSETSSTTLVSGKVAVQFKGDNNELQLAPSEQMLIDSLDCVEVAAVNTEAFTSWKEHRFVFDNEKLSDIAVKMRRCYGMDIFVGENYRDYRFSGRVSYNRGVDYFIKVLKETEGIRCQFKDGKLLVGVK